MKSLFRVVAILMLLGLISGCGGSSSSSDDTTTTTNTYYKDADGDGYSDGTTEEATTASAGYYLATALTATSGDCNDDDAAINPGATEVCDGVDNNCNAEIDEGVTTAYYADVDGDTYGDPADMLDACTQPLDYVTDNTDCDDTSAAINPGATELCDGVDNDCNGATLDGTSEVWDGTACDGDDTDECVEGTFSCVAGTQTCSDTSGSTPEICDGIDNDCDGSTDEGFTLNAPCSVGVGICQEIGITVCTADNTDTECNATPGDPETEVCDSLDNDCDGDVDEALTQTCYEGPDGTQDVGICSAGEESCTGGMWGDCVGDIIPAVEVCDGLDNDCDGAADDGLTFDTDADGYTSIGSCEGSQDDCDDGDPANFPGNAEVCDGSDNDCDGAADEGLPISLIGVDADGDSFGVGPGFSSCMLPDHADLALGEDCDDDDPDTNPAAEEIWYDNVDQDCSGGSDYDADMDGHDFIAFPGGTDCDDTDPTIYLDAPELCDGLDNDCDTNVDDGLTFDVDGDGHSTTGSCAGTQDDCDDVDPANFPGNAEVCDGSDNDCDGLADEPEDLTAPSASKNVGVCNGSLKECSGAGGWIDPDFFLIPDYEEIESLCDGKDNDCDAEYDEGLLLDLYPDLDNDGWGDDGAAATQSCDPLPDTSSMQGDCDDTDPTRYNGAPELCDGLDNDCDMIVDNGCAEDLDGDSYTIAAGDCDDFDPSTFPGAPEFCNGQDNDCDGVVDNNNPIGALTLYPDADGDGYGDMNTSPTLSCDFIPGYNLVGDDCDDGDPAVNPSAPEVCNLVDDNCDGSVDEGLPTSLIGVDADGDNFGVTPGISSCVLPGHADLAWGEDCDDGDDLINPAAEEIWYDNVDQDCSGGSDYDADMDGYDLIGFPGGTDCDDTDWMIRPDANEECDGLDNNCDGQADEGLICFEVYDYCAGPAIPFDEIWGGYIFDFGFAAADYNDPANCPAIGDIALGWDVVIPVTIPAGARMYALIETDGEEASAYITDACGGDTGCLASAVGGAGVGFTLNYKNETVADIDYFMIVDQAGVDPTPATVTFGACNNANDGPELLTVGDDIMPPCALSLTPYESYDCLSFFDTPVTFAFCVQECVTDNSPITPDCNDCYSEFAECIANNCPECETAGSSDAQMEICGACVDTACSPARDFCALGGAPCALGLDECNGDCTDILTDDQNCGQCNNDCGVGGSCSDGGCVCDPDFQDCLPDGTVCDTNVSYDDSNCGDCGVVCGIDDICTDGVCVPQF